MSRRGILGRIGHIAWWRYVHWVHPLADRLGSRWGRPSRMIRWPIPMLVPFRRRRLDVARGEALGDLVMCTPAFRELKRRNPDCHLTLYTRQTAVAGTCPYVDEIRPTEEAPPDAIWMDYESVVRFNRRPDRHLAQIMGDSLGLDIQDVRPACEINPVEVSRFREAWKELPRPHVVIVRKGGHYTPNKNWPDEYWEELIDRLLARGTVIEVGVMAMERRPREVPNFVDLFGRTTLPGLMAAIAAADLHIAPDTGTVHLAAAADVPSVVIYGGFLHPASTEYPGNISLYSPVECAPCWLTTPCPHGKKCLHQITPDQVEAAVSEITSRVGGQKTSITSAG